MSYKIFKPEYLVSVSGGEIGIISEITTIFSDQVPQFLTSMRDLLSQGNYHELGLLAHKAKGSVSVLGMDETASMLKEFELLAREGKESDRYKEFIDRFEADTTVVISEINDYISKNS